MHASCSSRVFHILWAFQFELFFRKVFFAKKFALQYFFSIQNKMYAIAWRMPNGHSGQGFFVLTRIQAEAWIVSLRKDHPDIVHWIVSEESVQRVDEKLARDHDE
jgi:hypothetical protein